VIRVDLLPENRIAGKILIYPVLAERRVFDEEVAVQRAADRVCIAASRGRDSGRGGAARWISEASFYNWRKKYGGLMPSEMRRLKQLDEENARLKKLVADLSLDKEMLQDVIRRKI